MRLMTIAVVAISCTTPDRDTAPPAGGIVDQDGEVLPPDEPEDTSDADRDGVSSADGDCDDSNPALTPFATDIAGDGIDQNCDGIDGTDADADGVASHASGGIDCDDNDPATGPSAPDTVGDGRDQSCDGVDGTDADGDGFPSVASGGADCEDANPLLTPADEDADGASTCDGDCDDDDPELNPLDDDGDGFSNCDGDCDDTRDWLFPYDGDEDGVYDACGYRAISAGFEHACAIDSAGEVRCWGADYSGQASPPSGNFTQISAGVYGTCGVTEAQAVQCWGRNSYGEGSPPSGSFTEVAMGGQSACALTTSGQLRCWGYSYSGPPSGTFTRVARAYQEFCATESTGNIICWDRYWGPQGEIRGSFAAPLGGDYNYSYGMTITGEVERWASFSYTTTGEPTFWGSRLRAVSINGNNLCGVSKLDSTIVCTYSFYPDGEWSNLSLGLGGDFLCAIGAAGELECWGSNSAGQLFTP